jgi:LPPG:FO 2-phospho-L-lactate transferase
VSSVELLALSGGVGGAKLALGLQSLLPDDRLACLVNTGDDFEHLGVHISPDIDTLLYTLAGESNPTAGWGRADETWSFMGMLGRMGGPTWFQLGDADLALHVERTRRLQRGDRLTEVTAHFAACLGIAAQILPMSDTAVRTVIQTDTNSLGFQEYFVRHRAEPVLRGIAFRGHESARLSREALTAIASPTLRAIIICPSNPYLSIDPILSVPGVTAVLRRTGVPIVAVSPLIGGRAVKGPTAKIMAELGVPTTPEAVAAHYHGLIDGLVIDTADGDRRHACGVPTLVVPTLMESLQDRITLAARTVEFAATLPRR